MARQTIQLHDDSGQRKYLTHSERVLFLQACGSLTTERALFCKTLLFCGCRISEALQLTRARIDEQNQTVVFRTLKRRKTNHQRAVPAPSEIVAGLLSLPVEKQENQLWEFSRRTAWITVKAVMAEAGISGTQACPKGLRHGFGIACAENNVPVSLIMSWLGHASIETTIIYLNAVGKEEQNFAKRTWPSIKPSIKG
ncbi:tyrosine-type recombinase/integrase [Roseibacillus persicicus]|uniref:tyrosine-type recombinase/integrase n=1 Tax=Roseibacillus persicicus TaxID=454148 RepID=UPI00398B9282